MTSSPPRNPGLRKAIKLRHAVALYASSVLGPGMLVIPGITARIAGPGSILAWVLLSLASFPFAFTFAKLSARSPESGGIYSFAKEAFGRETATVTGWLFAFWVITGAPAVGLIAASYLGYAFPLDRMETFLVGFGIFVLAFIVNYRGIVMSNKVQLATIGSIVALLLAAIIASSFFVKSQNFTPFLPEGWVPVGTAAALIFWCYLGYENVSNVAEEFENPQRDFYKSIILSVVLISILYTAVAIVTVGTLAYEASGGNVAPFAVILASVLGKYGAAGAAILAIFITFGTVNAYTTGMSRVFYAVSKDRGFPKSLDHLSAKTGVPDRSLMALFGCVVPVFVIYYFFNVNLESALLIPSGAAILVYIIGSGAGVKLLGHLFGGDGSREQEKLLSVNDNEGKNKKKKHVRMIVAFPIISLLISLAVLPFVGWLLTASLTVAMAALGYTWIVGRRRN